MIKSTSLNLFPAESLEQSQKVSFSCLKTFLQCPFRFQQKFILKRADAKAMYYHFIGTTIHNVVRHYDYEASFEDNNSNLTKLLESRWSDRYFFDVNQSNHWFEESKHIIGHFAQFAKERGKPLLQESGVKCTFGKFQLNGRVDRVDRDFKGCEIIDYKVGDIVAPSAEALLEDYQWLFYYLCVKQTFMLEPSRFTYYFLRANQEVVIEYSKDLLDRELPKFQHILDKMFSASAYEPSENIYCQDCAFFEECSLRGKNVC